MASVAEEPNGRRRIPFTATVRTRKTLRLGNATAKQALAIKVKMEQFITSKSTGVTDDEVLYGRLSAVGLVTRRTMIHYLRRSRCRW